MTGGHANMEVKNCKDCGRLFNCVMDAEKNLNKSFRK